MQKNNRELELDSKIYEESEVPKYNPPAQNKFEQDKWNSNGFNQSGFKGK